jgi:hypothetical protein
VIVYNVARKFFTEKADAETYRKLRGLPPSFTLKLEVSGRADLAALLNGLCTPPVEPQPVLPPATVALVEAAYVCPHIEVPDFVPLFLIDKDQREQVRADRAARGLLA